jgi:lantibiotic modifying enzyme
VTLVPGLDATALLASAARIGDAIAESAVFSGDRCGFVGAWPEEGPGGTIVMTYRGLGPDLYGGTAGIGLFLAELAERTGDPEQRKVALGALRHAASRVATMPPSASAGLYGGRPGVAIALARGGTLLGADDLVSAAAATADPGLPGDGDEFDLISGGAGAIVGCLALRLLLDREDLLDVAVAHAEALIATARASGDGLAWHSAQFPSSRGLAGLSHGASGVALALLELSTVRDDPRYRETAARAFAYEASLYDEAAGNWPDLREAPGQPTPAEPSFATFWCHGAPGVALSRVRALELGYADGARAEAAAALATTAAWVRAGLLSGGANYSVCHGLAGNAEVLLEGRDILGVDALDLVRTVAQSGSEQFDAPGREWPCGVNGGLTPALFLGTAGIGRFLLRLAHPDLPSLLLPRPEAL